MSDSGRINECCGETIGHKYNCPEQEAIRKANITAGWIGDRSVGKVYTPKGGENAFRDIKVPTLRINLETGETTEIEE